MARRSRVIAKTARFFCGTCQKPYYIEGTRKQLRRATLTSANREASLILTNLAKGEPDVLALTSTDRLIYLRACDALATTRVPLDVAVSNTSMP